MSGWTLAEFLDGAGEPFTGRVRATAPGAGVRARYPLAAWLGWPWGPIASEAEEDAILDQMIRFETAAHAAAQRSGSAMLVAAVTTGQGREWLFHVADERTFLVELAAGEGWPALQIRVEADPEWRAARALTSRAAMH